MAVELQILVSVGGLPVNGKTQIAHGVPGDDCDQHGDKVVGLLLLCEVDGWVHGIDVGGEFLYEGVAEGHNSVVHIATSDGELIGKVLSALVSNHSINKLATIGVTGDPIAAPSIWE